MKDYIIKKYIDKITNNNIYEFALKNNIILNNEEINYIHKLINIYWNDILKNNDDILLKIKNKFDNNKYEQIKKLYYEYKNKYINYIEKN